MELEVYNWEKFERGKSWFVYFAIIILVVVVFSVLSSNIPWWVIVLVLTWGYIFYITKISDKIKLVTWKQALQIWKRVFPYEDLNWFVLEYHTEKKKIHNIVIVYDEKHYEIFTIDDTEENLKNFVGELNWYIPMLDNYEQSTMDKFIRKCKL